MPVLDCQESIAKLSPLLIDEIKKGRDVAWHKCLLARLRNGFVWAELLPEEDCTDERAALDVPYGDHIGDFLLHLN